MISHQICKNLTTPRSVQEHRDLLADALDTLELQDGQAVFRQGDIGNQFYIVKSGRVNVLKGPDTKPLAELHGGQFFGERSLIRDDPRLVHFCMMFSEIMHQRLVGLAGKTQSHS